MSEAMFRHAFSVTDHHGLGGNVEPQLLGSIDDMKSAFDCNSPAVSGGAPKGSRQVIDPAVAGHALLLVEDMKVLEKAVKGPPWSN